MKPSRVLAILIVCAAEWLTGWVTHRSAPAGFDFIAIYASARLVATGQPAAVVDREAIFAVERATLPERDIYLNNPNPPALSLILAPIGALPFEIAYAVMLTLSVAALAAAAFLIAPLAAADQRFRLFPFALLAPPSTIALAHGQTTPLLLLAVAASLRAPRWPRGLRTSITLPRLSLPTAARSSAHDPHSSRTQRPWPGRARGHGDRQRIASATSNAVNIGTITDSDSLPRKGQSSVQIQRSGPATISVP